jgi:hypothetical protein
MTKPIIGAIAAALACLAGSPGMARALANGPQAEPSRITETGEGFAICTCASACGATTEKRPVSIRVGAHVRLDPAVLKASRLSEKDSRHAK